MVIISGSANKPLAEILNKKVYFPCTEFADGEISVQIPENLRKRETFIIQSTSAPANKHLMELLLMIDAAKRASSTEINAVIPYFGYARQDRKDRPRVPVSASLISKLIKQAGADRILTLDAHSGQQQGFFDGPWDNLYASKVLVPAIKKLNIKNLVVVSPDKGGAVRATAYARRLNAEGLAIVYKERDTNIKNQSKSLDMQNH